MANLFRVITLGVLGLLVVLLLGVPGHARELRAAVGFALPPYVIRDAGRGLEVDIIREALAEVGHTVKFVYLPNLRLPVEYGQGNVDCVVSNVAYDLGLDSGRRGYPSNTTLSYQNFAITLKSSGISIDSIADLATRRVLAFNNAVKYLGEEFSDVVARNPEYAELADQSLQVRMLYSGRVQVVVSDKRIFQWWHKKLLGAAGIVDRAYSQEADFHPVFPPAHRHVTFASPEDRDAFNEGLARIKASGRFEAIVQSYVGSEIR